MKKSTQELLELLNSTKDIKTYLNAQEASLTPLPLHELIEIFLDQKKISRKKCIEDANLQRNYGYQILSGMKKPSRDKTLAISLALRLTPEETSLLLRSAGYNDLYVKNQKDSVVYYALMKNLSVIETNHLLYDIGEKILE